ncbi:MAG: hypothetical protein U0W40_16200 [Acidimicrobiia bacterium]
MLKDLTQDPIVDRAGKPFVTLSRMAGGDRLAQPSREAERGVGRHQRTLRIADELRFDPDIRAAVLRGRLRQQGEDLKPETDRSTSATPVGRPPSRCASRAGPHPSSATR